MGAQRKNTVVTIVMGINYWCGPMLNNGNINIGGPLSCRDKNTAHSEFDIHAEADKWRSIIGATIKVHVAVRRKTYMNFPIHLFIHQANERRIIFCIKNDSWPALFIKYYEFVLYIHAILNPCGISRHSVRDHADEK